MHTVKRIKLVYINYLQIRNPNRGTKYGSLASDCEGSLRPTKTRRKHQESTGKARRDCEARTCRERTRQEQQKRYRRGKRGKYVPISSPILNPTYLSQPNV
jgi:hypothetical protein